MNTLNAVEKKLASKVTEVVAKKMIADYVQLEREIAKSEKSKVMWYQRRVGMKLVLSNLGLTDDDYKTLHEASKAKSA